MKKNLFYYLFVMLFTVGVFTSCSDDDEPDYSQVIEQDIAGTYKGTLDIDLEGVQVGKDMPKNITIGKVDATSISLELKDFSFQSLNLGTIKIEKCVLQQDAASYSFTGSQEVDLTASGIGKCPTSVNGTVNNGAITVNLDIEVPQLNQTVKVVYGGSRLSGTESSDAEITSFSFDTANEANRAVIEQPVINGNTITFRVDAAIVAETPDVLKTLVPTFTISDKATCSLQSGVATDFSADVTYTVIAENGTVKEYVVKAPVQSSVLKFTFDEWTTVGSGPAKHDEPLPSDMLASSVQGASLLFLFGVEGFPLYKSTDDVVAGEAAAKLVTMDTSAQVSRLVPALTAGSVFTGTFNISSAMSDRLSCTRFGISYDKKPVTFKGWYKYAAGEKYIDGEGATEPEDVKVVEGKVDECSIMAVLYEVEKDEDGENIPLTGHDINSSPRRVAVAALADGTNKAEWTSFELPFEFLDGKTYEAGKEYQLAIVCSSSKDGDLFKGAGGSTLMLDELEIIGE